MRASVQQYRACADFSGCELEERRRLHHLRESARRTSRRSGRSVCAVFQRSSADGGYPPNTLLIVERLAQPECKLRYHLQIYERLSDNLRYVCLIALAGPEVEQNSGRGGEARGNRNSSVAIADKFGLPQRGRRERHARTVWRVHHGQISPASRGSPSAASVLRSTAVSTRSARTRCAAGCWPRVDSSCIVVTIESTDVSGKETASIGSLRL